MSTMNEALAVLTALIEEIDTAATEDREPNVSQYDFEFSKNEFKRCIDRKAFLLKQLDAQTEILAATIAKLQKQKKAFESASDNIKARTKEYVESHPELDFKGELFGFKVINAGGKLGIAWDEKEKPLAIPRVVLDPSKYPAEYLDKMEVHVLRNTFDDAIRDGLLTNDCARVNPRSRVLKIT